MKKVVFTFGRLNPPTVGHEKLVNKVKSVARKENADARVYLSQTQNKKKDPLDYGSKINYAKKAFGNIVTKSKSKTIMQVMVELQDAGYTDVVLVVGSDRVTEFKKLLTKYNGKEYEFGSITVQSAGQRDPDAEGVEGISASKMRAIAKDGDLELFRSGLPKPLRTSSKEIFDKIRSIMEESDLEDLEDLEEASLTLQQRQKRSRTMKRLATKIHRKAKVQKRRMADTKRLQKRALKKARDMMRKKVAGEKGEKYASLSSSQKISIDKMVDKKKSIIVKMAKKLLPKVRRAEMERLKKQRSGSTNEEYILVQERIDPRKEPNLYRAQREIEREKERDIKKFDRLRDNARIRDTIYRNRKQGLGENEKDDALDEGFVTDILHNLVVSAKMKKFIRWYLNWRRSHPGQGMRGVVKSAQILGLSPMDAKKMAEKLNKMVDKGDLPKHLAITEEVSPEKNKKSFKDIAEMKRYKDLVSEEKETDPCWKDYKQIGMKDKNGKKVPNCVPEEAESVDEVVGRYSPLKQARLKKEKEDREKREAPKRNPGTGLRKEEYGCESETKKKNDKSYKKLKAYKDVLPVSGAGQEGTDEVVNTYKQQTPGASSGDREMFNILENFDRASVREAEAPRMNRLLQRMNIKKGDTLQVRLNATGSIGKSGEYDVRVKNIGKQFITVEHPNGKTTKFRNSDGHAVGVDAYITGKDGKYIGDKKYWSCQQWRKGKKVQD